MVERFCKRMVVEKWVVVELEVVMVEQAENGDECGVGVCLRLMVSTVTVLVVLVNVEVAVTTWVSVTLAMARAGTTVSAVAGAAIAAAAERLHADSTQLPPGQMPRRPRRRRHRRRPARAGTIPRRGLLMAAAQTKRAVRTESLLLKRFQFHYVCQHSGGFLICFLHNALTLL